MTGPDALQAFTAAAKAVREQRYDDALKLPLLPTDREIIERRIEQARNAASVNNNERKT